MKELIIDKKSDGKKLTNFLLDAFPSLSLNTIYKTLRKKDIRINNIKINENVLLHKGDVINLYIPDNILYSKLNLDIVYEDDNIILINKPVNIEVTGKNSLTEYLKSCYDNFSFIEPCHRLDRNTTGIVLFAKNEQSLAILLNKFKNHEIEKHYFAKVYGIPKKNKQILTAYLFKDSKKSIVYISDFYKKGYEKIITSYEIKSFNTIENTSILDINLHTGKTHQIRAHLAHIGFPIIGDGKYGNNSINKKFKCNFQQLCSYSLKFNFTTNNGILEYLNNKEFKLDFTF